jgi:hypothetical protein
MSSVQERTKRLNCERSGRVGIAQFGVGVAVEVPLAGETAPTGNDGQGKHFASREGCLRTRALL